MSATVRLYSLGNERRVRIEYESGKVSFYFEALQHTADWSTYHETHLPVRVASDLSEVIGALVPLWESLRNQEIEQRAK